MTLLTLRLSLISHFSLFFYKALNKLLGSSDFGNRLKISSYFWVFSPILRAGFWFLGEVSFIFIHSFVGFELWGLEFIGFCLLQLINSKYKTLV